MGPDVGLGVLGWGLLALMAIAFGFIGLRVDAIRQRAIRDQQRRSIAGVPGPDEHKIKE